MLRPLTPYKVKVSPYIIPGLKANKILTTADAIIQAVCDEYDIVLDVLCKRKRTAKIIEPRYVAMYLLVYYSPLSKVDIAKRLGGYDHSTVIHAVKQMNNLLLTDPDLLIKVLRIKSKCDLH